ncbi:MAG: hypothetical protein DMF90_19845 [Acidobacteria bacterium]|nr:MAG: hypothetical protein DMF90_19845 [Acidobacteriota bacterium]
MTDHPATAVVLGASMSGLLAARALSPIFNRIIIVERDALPDGATLRQGVPQAAHAHGLLASGYRVMDAYFPNLMGELESLGACLGDVVGDFLWFQYGRWKLRHQSGLGGIVVSRPCLEAAIRRAVRAIPNVTFLDETPAVMPTFDKAANDRRRPCRGCRWTGIPVAEVARGVGIRIARHASSQGRRRLCDACVRATARRFLQVHGRHHFRNAAGQPAASGRSGRGREQVGDYPRRHLGRLSTHQR